MSRSVCATAALALAALGLVRQVTAQETASPRYQVDVNLVAVTFTVTDSTGRPVHGLKAADVSVSEDGMRQRIAAFVEGSSAAVTGLPAIPPGTAVFILFDTSNHMYTNIPYVCDAIADFLRHFDPADAVAIYTFSRNLSRAVPLTSDRLVARAGLAQRVSVGDDTALFNCLLLTLRDAAKVTGRKAIVVFSNGPDNSSMLSPEDVGTVAVDEGIPVYIISTLDPAKDCLTAKALERLTARTGGQLYLARKWQSQTQALSAIREQIGASYTAFYYPAANPNNVFRHITVDVVQSGRKTYTVRARNGYQPRTSAVPKSN